MKNCAYSFVLTLLLVCGLQAQTRLTTMHHIPNGDFLFPYQYQLKINTNIFNGRKNIPLDSAAQFKVGALAESYFGITEFLMVGIQAGYQPSLSFKGKALSEKGDFIPTISLEAHNIFNSTEAAFYKIKEDSIITPLQNTFSAMVSKSFMPITLRVHLGMQYLPSLTEKKFCFVGGLEKYLGWGFYTSFETFQRFGTFHSNFGFSWRKEDNLMISFGLSEAKQYFFSKDGDKFGFFFGGHDPGANGYNTPGFFLTVCYSASLKTSKDGMMSLNDEVRSQSDRLDKLETQIKLARDSVSILSGRLETFKKEGFFATSTDTKPVNASTVATSVLNDLKKMVEIMQNDPYNPDDVNVIVQKILKLGKEAVPTIKAAARDKTLDARVRCSAVNMLGRMQLSDVNTAALLIELIKEPVVDLRVEALLTIGKLKIKDALAEVKLLVNDPEEAVAMTAADIAKQLEGAYEDSEAEKAETNSIPKR